jgi:hypothetical protein
MIALLTDPWFDAEFYGKVTEAGSFTMQGEDINGAQGLFLWCPCGYGDPAFPIEGGRPHGLLVPFSNPRNALVPPANHGPQSRNDPNMRPRWIMNGSSLHDLSLAPSIAVGTPECWHGFITNGIVR